MANDGRWKVLEENMETTLLWYYLEYLVIYFFFFFSLYLFYVKTISFHDSYPLND